jgi:hypothetical protein
MQPFNLEAIEIINSLTQGSSEQRIRGLTEFVFALLMEVEALRRAMMEESKAKGVAPKDSAYGKAYRKTALLTHNGVGPGPPRHKLLPLWFPVKTNPDGIDLREALMLIRLGFSPDEISAYASDAEHLEMLT